MTNKETKAIEKLIKIAADQKIKNQELTVDIAIMSRHLAILDKTMAQLIAMHNKNIKALELELVKQQKEIESMKPSVAKIKF